MSTEHPRRPSRTWHRLPLAAQVFLAVFASTALVFAGYFVFDLKLTRARLNALERSTFKATGPLLQTIIEDSMLRGTRQHVDDLFTQLRRNHRNEVAYLLDADKQMIDTNDLAKMRKPRRGPAPSLDPTRFVVLDLPLPAKPACLRCHSPTNEPLGYIRIISPLDQAQRALIAQAPSRLLLAGAGLLFMGALCLLLIRGMVHRPMRRLIAAMKEAGRGHLDTRVDESLGGELETIARSFNGMLARLEEDQRRIIELHRRQVAHMDRLASLGELAAQLAHEVRNPLTGLSSAIQVLLQGCPPEHARYAVMHKMLAQLGRMDKSIGSFLSYARMPDAVERPFSLEDPIARVVFLVEPRLKQQQVEFIRRFNEPLPPVKGDPGQIEQVLLNLCLNALQAMPQGGRLTLSGCRAGADVQLEIADTGQGIAAADLDAVFKPFFTTKENGSGLGLPISRQIVTAHGGTLWLESIPGKGTTAFVKLPTLEPQALEA